MLILTEQGWKFYGNGMSPQPYVPTSMVGDVGPFPLTPYEVEASAEYRKWQDAEDAGTGVEAGNGR